MSKRPKKAIGFLTLVLFTTYSCAPKVQTQVLMPARFSEAAQYRKIAVLPFDSPRNSKLSGFHLEVESALAGVHVDGRPFFELLDRTTIEKVLQEHRLSLSALMDPSSTLRIGKLLGARGIYIGSVAAPRISEEYYREERTRCLDDNCKRVSTYNVTCLERTVYFSFTPRLIDVENGRVVYSRTISSSATSSGCRDTTPPQPAAELLQEAKNTAIKDFVMDVAPYYVSMSLKLMDSDEGIKSSQDRKKFQSALEFAKAGRMDRACKLWEEIENTGAVSVMYNLGVCREIEGNIHKALEFYRKADSMLHKPDRNINEAIQRVQKRLRDEEKLRLQLR